jgi:hypothetical protein
MIRTVCAWCGAVKQDGPGQTSHGMCEICATAFKLSAQKALMKPRATRFDDCIYCRYRDLDLDGVPDGCMVAKCINPDRRDPWGLR